jgi:uncharacterized coiled-coil DUF342 family protein
VVAVPDLEPDPLDEHGAPRATAGGLSADRCQQLAVQRASIYARKVDDIREEVDDIREEVDDIREEVDDIREEVDDRSQVEGELEHAELCAGEGDKNDAMRDRFIEELRHEMATVDKLPPECIDREIITVLQMSIANLQAERFRLERLSGVPWKNSA